MFCLVFLNINSAIFSKRIGMSEYKFQFKQLLILPMIVVGIGSLMWGATPAGRQTIREISNTPIGIFVLLAFVLIFFSYGVGRGFYLGFQCILRSKEISERASDQSNPYQRFLSKSPRNALVYGFFSLFMAAVFIWGSLMAIREIYLKTTPLIAPLILTCILGVYLGFKKGRVWLWDKK